MRSTKRSSEGATLVVQACTNVQQLQHPGLCEATQAQPVKLAKPVEQTCPCCKKGIMQQVMDLDFEDRHHCIFESDIEWQ